MNTNKFLLLLMFGLLVLNVTTTNTSAVQLFQYNYERFDNLTTRLHTEIYYSTFEKPVQPQYSQSVSGAELILVALTNTFLKITGFYTSNTDGTQNLLLEDSIESGKPLEFYYLFSTYVDTWNNQAPDNRVEYCNFTIYYSPATSNKTAIFSQVYASSVTNGKYFVKLKKGDSSTADMDCVFSGNRTMEIPADVTVVTPTWECKECQFYNWYKEYIQIDKAQTLGSYRVAIWGYIEQLVRLNIEVIYVLFWILLIELALLIFSLIFFSAWWFYLKINRMAR